MPKAKQTSINIFLRNPVPNDDREEKNQNPDPEVQVNVIQTEDEDADAVPVKKRRTKRSFRNEWLEQFKWLRYGTVDGVEKITCSFCQRFGKSNGFTRVTVMAGAFYIWPVN